MEDDVKTLGDYISIAWRRKFHILIPFVVVLIVTVATIFLLPPVYKSTGTILIESQQIPQELIQSTVTSFADERIQIIKQRIMTSQQLFGIIKKFNLFKDELNTTARSEILEDMRDRIIIDRVSANVKNQRNRASALIAFTVSFEHRYAGMAQKVANELVTLFLDENIKSRTERAEETSDFLRKESERLGAQIEAMGEQIANYKQQYEGSLPESLKLNLERVVAMKTALLTAEADINSLNERKKLLQIDLDTLQSSPDGGLNEEQQLQKQELTNLQNQYISLAARYGAGHPDVKAIKRQIAAFEEEYGNLSDINELKIQQKEVKKEMLELAKKYSSEHPDVKRLERKLDGIVSMIAEFDKNQRKPDKKEPNPLLLQVKAKLESVDSSIARIKKSKLDLESQIKELDARISRTPQVERGLEALERDYENTRHKYQEMKTKQSQAELSKSLEEEQKGERFTLLEPPLLPDKPIKPNRPKVFMLGLILSFVSGFGVAGLAESLDGGIRGSRALANVTKLTPLVTIPYITTLKDAAVKRRNIRIFIAAVIVLMVISIAMVHFFYKPLDLLWFIVLRKLNLA
jgi:succinoglycan biosynthesis transport protein ExoP